MINSASQIATRKSFAGADNTWNPVDFLPIDVRPCGRFGQCGDDGNTLFGGQNDDLLDGQEGHDRVDGNRGDDTLYGDAGVDTFVISKGDDWVMDFSIAEDKIESADAFAALTQTVSNGNWC